MAKKPCVVCKKEVGLFSRTDVSNCAVCSECLHKAGMVAVDNLRLTGAQSISAFISSRQKQSFVANFSATKSVGYYLQVDETHKAFAIAGNIFTYDNLLNFELLEDGQSVTKGGVGRAIVGGALFGLGGAIVGGVTGKKTTKNICNSMKLMVSLKDAHTALVHINFITTGTKTNSFAYSTAQENAQKCIAALEMIKDAAQSVPQSSVVTQTVSAADEIAKLKILLDQNIITQDEFDAKKKELLGL